MNEEIPVTQGTTEWHEWRKKGIGATDAAAICGYSKWKSPIQVFVDKTQEVPRTEQNEYQEWGTRIEPILIDKVADEYAPQIEEIERGGMYIHPDVEWAKASLDGAMKLKDGSLVIIECKTGKDASDWSPVPEGYYAQAQWQMFVTGLDTVLFSVLIRGTEWFDRVVDRDQPFIDDMYAKCYDFWNNYVLTGTIPPVTQGEKDLDGINAILMATQDEGKRPEKEVDVDLINKYMMCKQVFAQAQDNYDKAKAELAALMVDGSNLTYDGQRIASFVSRAGNLSVDKKLLQELYPDAYNSCLKRGSPVGYTKFSI